MFRDVGRSKGRNRIWPHRSDRSMTSCVLHTTAESYCGIGGLGGWVKGKERKNKWEVRQKETKGGSGGYRIVWMDIAMLGDRYVLYEGRKSVNIHHRDGSSQFTVQDGGTNTEKNTHVLTIRCTLTQQYSSVISALHLSLGVCGIY